MKESFFFPLWIVLKYSLTHHEFHVTSTRGLCSGGGDLLGQIGSRHDLLGVRDAIVLKENDLELVADNGVVVDDGTHTVEELNNLLGHVVAGSSFAT